LLELFGKCKRGGNVLDFVSLKEGIGIREAALRIQKWFNIESPRSAENGKPRADSPPATRKERSGKKSESESDSQTENKPLSFSLQNLDKTHPYLAERGLTPETIDTFELGFCKKGILADHIAIPIHNAAGKLVAYAGRWPGEPPDDKPKYKLPAGFKKSLELFNLHRAAQASPEQPLVIVEGFFDCIKLWQHGVKRVVALMGSTLSPAQEELIRKHAKPASLVLVMLDEDEAGRAGSEDIVLRLSGFCYVKRHSFEDADMQPEYLSAEQAQQIIGGLQ
jgi:DNA primase